MKNIIYRLVLVCLTAVSFTKCAKKGPLTGGPKDETAPVMVTAKPPYESINFKEKKIKLYFDEYVVLRGLGKQLIVSPPMQNPPLITPQGIATKKIEIEILDTLQQNTTYIFNFGSAIQDLNEGNKLETFKYVFSTGNLIDSLSLRGSVTDALEKEPKKNVSILLYKADSTYKDSLLYKQKPNYVTNTTDSINFKFSNVKEGKYFVFALNEEFNDYIFDSKEDKIGFLKDTLNLPKDSVLIQKIVLFKEEQPFRLKKAKEGKKGKILFVYTGKQTNLSVKPITKTSNSFIDASKNKKDTLHYWFSDTIKIDSLKFIVSNNNFIDTLNVRLKKTKIDSLKVTSSITKSLNFLDTIYLHSNNPIIKINSDSLKIKENDSIPVKYTVKQKEINKIAVLFDKKFDAKYAITILPKTLTDIYQVSNDTLKYQFKTKNKEDYGNINLNIQNKTSENILIELLEKTKVIRKTIVSKKSETISFDLLDVKKYTIRAIIDTNKNNIWDTGNFLKKIEPERIIYFEKEIELRPNWIFNESFIIE